MHKRETAFALAAACAAAAAALAAPPLMELASLSRRYDVPLPMRFLSRAWGPGPGLFRDAGDQLYLWWRDHRGDVATTLLASMVVGALADATAVAAGLSRRQAIRARARFDIAWAFFFMWKLYGFFFWVVPAHLMANYLLVRALRTGLDHMQGKKAAPAHARYLALAVVWALNLGLVLYAVEFNAEVRRLAGPYEKPALAYLRALATLPTILMPGRLEWYHNLRFGLFRVIEFATLELLDPESRVPTDDMSLGHAGSFMHYALYAPIVWQGPLVGFGEFLQQQRGRYRLDARGRLKFPLPDPRVVWRAGGGFVFHLALLEASNHIWYAGMLFNRGVFNRMSAGETAALLVLKFFNTHLRTVMTWRFFELWAALDGVTVPDNFPRFFATTGSVTALWRSYNASVHGWLLANVYTPVCARGGLPPAAAIAATFAFMAIWHGGHPSWICFSLLNMALTLWEFAMGVDPDARPSALSAPGRAVADAAVWACKLLALVFAWFNFSASIAQQWRFEKVRKLALRAFWDDAVDPKLAEEFHIDLAARAARRGFGGLVSHPLESFVRVFAVLVLLRLYRVLLDEARALGKDAPPLTGDASDQNTHGLDNAVDDRTRRDKAAVNAARTDAGAATICHVLRQRANDPADRDRSALLWLDGKGRPATELTFGQLHARASRLARRLLDRGLVAGDRVLLVFPPGTAFVEALFACMYAQLIAVPVIPPPPGEALTDAVLGRVADNCEPRLVLTDTTYLLARHGLAAKARLRRVGKAAVAVVALTAPMLLALLFAKVELTLKYNALAGMRLPDAEIKPAHRQGRLFEARAGSLLVALSSLASLYAVARLRVTRWLAPSDPRRAGDRAPRTKLATLPWLRVDTALEQPALGWLGRRLARMRDAATADFADLPESRDVVAYLQYTSGSTGDPKGVCVTHGNLMHQGRASQTAFACEGRGDTAVNWCPQYHDLGLVVCILSGIFAGIRLVAFSPLDFLRDPLLWVRAISKYRARFSAAPNFAYGYVARKARQAVACGALGPAELDLSCWSVAGNGGERVYAETLEAFEAEFARFGFRRQAHFPCFGLAEHTILASGRSATRLPTVLRVDGDRLAEGTVQEATAASSAIARLVGCGEALCEVDIRIVDPETALECADLTVGEVRLGGPSVARGYWGAAEETAAVFGTQLAGGARGAFLRTGDLGFLSKGELFLCGRLKDLIIVDGRNVYPQDVEAAAERAAPRTLRAGASAARGGDSGDVTLLVELRREAAGAPAETVRRACREAYAAVLEHQRVPLRSVTVLATRELPKTSSGKIRRRLAAERLAQGELREIMTVAGADLAAEAQAGVGQGVAGTDTGALLEDLADDPTFRVVLWAMLRANLAGIEPPASAPTLENVRDLLPRPLSHLLAAEGQGFSSLEAVQYASRVQQELAADGLHARIAATAALEFGTVAQLAQHLYAVHHRK